MKKGETAMTSYEVPSIAEVGKATDNINGPVKTKFLVPDPLENNRVTAEYIDPIFDSE
jgi:hypothetical protein